MKPRKLALLTFLAGVVGSGWLIGATNLPGMVLRASKAGIQSSKLDFFANLDGPLCDDRDRWLA